MSILNKLLPLLNETGLKVETGVFSEPASDEYLVLTPLTDSLDFYADDMPLAEIEEVRISLFTKENYISLRNQLTRLLLGAGFLITDRKYIGFETDTKYHYYVFDVLMEKEMEE